MRFFYCLCVGLVLSACVPSLKSLEKGLEKKSFAKTELQLLKRSYRIGTDPGGLYVRAQLYADSSNARFQLDTAYALVRRAIQRLPEADSKVQRELDKMRWSKNTFFQFQRKIESDAFGFYRKMNTETGYQSYAERFVEAPEVAEATTRQHALAFADAARQHTYQAYQSFLRRYPTAAQAEEAQARYDILLFQDKTKDNSLSSYENFLRQYPETPHRKQVETAIYQLFIKDAEPQTYLAFINRYPTNHRVGDAWQWIGWLSPDKRALAEAYPQSPLRQQWLAAHDSTQRMVFPFGEGGRIGFVDREGSIQVRPEWAGIPEQTRCEGIAGTDWLLITDSTNDKQGAINRAGFPILPTRYDSITELGSPTLKACLNGSCQILLKNGQPITEESYQDLKGLASGWVAYKKNNFWGLMTHNGKVIFEARFADITALDAQITLLRQPNKTTWLNRKTILDRANERPTPEMTFWKDDDWRLSHGQFFLLRKNAKWGVQKIDGQEVIAFSGDQIRETPRGWALQKDGYWSLFDFSGREIYLADAEDIIIDEQGYGVRSAGKWGAIAPSYRTTIKPTYDSLAFIRGGGLLWKAKQRFVFFQDQAPVDITAYKSFQIQMDGRQRPFLIVENRSGKKGILDAAGKSIAPTVYEDITISGAYASVARYGKRGLLRLSDGKLVLKTTYDGLAANEAGYFSLLQNRRFGLYHPDKNQQIRPGYTALLSVYDTAGVFVAQKDEGRGLIDVQDQGLLPFRYTEILYWNDTSAWVKLDAGWFLETIKNRKEETKPLLGPFESLRLQSYPYHQLAFAYQEGKASLWHNQKNVLIRPTYSDLWNIGTEEEPFYWAELWDEAQQVWQIDYLDDRGKRVFGQMLPTPLYQRLVCD